jgi:DNA repair protein RadA
MNQKTYRIMTWLPELQDLLLPDTFFGDPKKAAGGGVLGHASTYRIYLRKSGENRTAKMIDSPFHPYSATRFTLNEKGTDDLEDELASLRKRNKKN